MLKMLILVCALGMDHSACNVHSATNVFHGPDQDNSHMCMMASQQVVAQAAQSIDPTKEYVKVVCTNPDGIRQSASRDGSTLVPNFTR